MKRLQNLQHLIADLEESLTKRIQLEERQSYMAFEQQLYKVSRKISLAEKRYDVKNTRSAESSEEY